MRRRFWPSDEKSFAFGGFAISDEFDTRRNAALPAHLIKWLAPRVLQLLRSPDGAEPIHVREPKVPCRAATCPRDGRDFWWDSAAGFLRLAVTPSSSTRFSLTINLGAVSAGRSNRANLAISARCQQHLEGSGLREAREITGFESAYWRCR